MPQELNAVRGNAQMPSAGVTACQWQEAGLVCQACAGDAPGGKCRNPRCVGGPIVRELVPAIETCAGCYQARPPACTRSAGCVRQDPATVHYTGAAGGAVPDGGACPWCRKRPSPALYSTDGNGSVAVICNQCGARGPLSDNEAAADAAWNTAGLKGTAE